MPMTQATIPTIRIRTTIIPITGCAPCGRDCGVQRAMYHESRRGYDECDDFPFFAGLAGFLAHPPAAAFQSLQDLREPWQAHCRGVESQGRHEEFPPDAYRCDARVAGRY